MNATVPDLIMQRGVRFADTKAWLDNPLVFRLNPNLTLDAGDFYPANSHFGIFMDSCSDRWGQVLMQRRETITAREAGRAKISLGAWEFLRGVQDHTRMGALRFTFDDQDDVFIADELRSAPPMTSLAELQAVALELTRKNSITCQNSRAVSLLNDERPDQKFDRTLKVYGTPPQGGGQYAHSAMMTAILKICYIISVTIHNYKSLI